VEHKKRNVNKYAGSSFPFKGMLHLWKDECIIKMGHLCRRNVKLFLNLELLRLRKARKCIFGLCG